MSETLAVRTRSDIVDRDLAPEGKVSWQWAAEQMPVLTKIGQRFAAEKPLAGQHLGLCLPIDGSAAHLASTLHQGGATLSICPNRSQVIDDGVAAWMVSELGASVFARQEARIESAMRSVLDSEPTLLAEDGGHLLTHALSEEIKTPALLASVEHSWAGIRRLNDAAGEAGSRLPIVCTGWSQARSLVDDRYGSGQSTVAGVLRAAKILLAGKTVVVVGYGRRGKGVAERAAGHGAEVIVVEIDPLRALEAHLDGYRLLSLSDAAPLGQVFITATGSCRVIRKKHFNAMQYGAFVCNCGYDDQEIDLEGLRELSREVRQLHPKLEECKLLDGRHVYLLAEGKPLHQTTSEGRPVEVVDLTYSHVALSLVWVLEQSALSPGFHQPPAELDRRITSMKLEALGLEIEEPTREQENFLDAWPSFSANS